MVSTFTPNIQLEEPARGDQVGTWDTPVNNNMTEIDLTIGAIALISLNNSPVVLSAAQFKSKTITFNSTLTGSVAITFPTSFIKSYEIQNLCTGSSAFIITLGTTLAGGQVICCPPGETIDCFNDGANIKFKNLGRIGSFWEYAGSSVPAWVSGCTFPPYLNCDGTVFSSNAFPALTTILGGPTLPDLRGVTRATLNQGTARMLSSNGGVDGNTQFSRGGLDSVVLSASQLPANIPNSVTGGALGGTTHGLVGITGGSADAVENAAAIIVTINPTGGALHTNVQPTTIAGITMIRSA